MSENERITVRQAADLLSCSTRTVRRHLAEHPDWDSHLDTSRGPSPVRVIARAGVLAFLGEQIAQDRALDSPPGETALARRDSLSRASRELTAALTRLAGILEQRERRDRKHTILALAVGVPILAVLAFLAFRLLATVQAAL